MKIREAIKGKVVRDVQVDGESTFLHFDDCILECRAILLRAESRVGHSGTFAPNKITIML